MTGAFDDPEDSERSRSLTRQWESQWPGDEPLGHLLRCRHGERWLRLHSLPESKQYPDSPEEYHEVIRRHRTVLEELLAGQSVDSLIVIAEDWDAWDLAGGWSKSPLPGAWPWRISKPDDSHGDGATYFWVTTELPDDDLDALLTAVADYSADIVLAPAGLDWLYCPYDGGADVILPTTEHRDALRDRYTEWLPID